MKRSAARATGFAILAAALYALNIPLSKSLLTRTGPTMMAAFLYLGAGLGLLALRLGCRAAGKQLVREPLTRRELPYTAAMVALDIIAPILLMLGIARTSSANVSLMNNFEIVATTLIALAFFRESVSKRLWAATTLITAASVLLSFEGAEGFAFNAGSLLVLGACACWGFENNCTRRLSDKSSVEIVTVKGCFSGLGSLLLALAAGERLPAPGTAALILALGFTSYGLSINFYILAQKELGAAKTSAWYSIAPFIGVGFSVLLGEHPRLTFYPALILMAAAAAVMARDARDAQAAAQP